MHWREADQSGRCVSQANMCEHQSRNMSRSLPAAVLNTVTVTHCVCRGPHTVLFSWQSLKCVSLCTFYREGNRQPWAVVQAHRTSPRIREHGQCWNQCVSLQLWGFFHCEHYHCEDGCGVQTPAPFFLISSPCQQWNSAKLLNLCVSHLSPP